MNDMFVLGTCPVCGFRPNDCHCGYDPNMTFTTTGGTSELLEWDGTATKWDGPVVLNSPQFVDAKPHKCPVCSGDGKLESVFMDIYDECHGCEGNGWVLV